MKKLTAILAILLIMSALAACGAKPSQTADDNTTTDETSSAPNTVAIKGFTFGDVALGDGYASVIEALGEPDDVFEEPSCAFEGVDKRLYYNGFEVHTYPDGENDFVLSVVFRDDMSETDEGAYIGMSRDEITEIYGDADESANNMLKYLKDGTSLTFLFNGEACIDITYYYDAALS